MSGYFYCICTNLSDICLLRTVALSYDDFIYNYANFVTYFLFCFTFILNFLKCEVYK
jgi:hypothetical protein